MCKSVTLSRLINRTATPSVITTKTQNMNPLNEVAESVNEVAASVNEVAESVNEIADSGARERAFSTGQLHPSCLNCVESNMQYI